MKDIKRIALFSLLLFLTVNVFGYSSQGFTVGDYKCFVVGSELIIGGYNGFDADLIIPRSIHGYPVTSIGVEAFRGANRLTSVTFPSTLKIIGEMAFVGCENLTTINIPDSVTAIGKKAFYWCENLTTIVISSDHPLFSVTDGGLSNKKTREFLFYAYGRKELNYDVPDGIMIIGESAFSQAQNLAYVKLPDSVMKIRDNAFYECENLTLVIVPRSVSFIGNLAFWGCDGLTLAITKGTAIEDYALKNAIFYTYSL